jgi:hypothetical protein
LNHNQQQDCPAGSVGSAVSDLVMPRRMCGCTRPRTLGRSICFSRVFIREKQTVTSHCCPVRCRLAPADPDVVRQVVHDGMAPLERSLCREVEPAYAGVGLASLRQVARELVAAANECAIEATQH